MDPLRTTRVVTSTRSTSTDPEMPPRKSTTSVTPAEADDSLQLSPPAPSTADKPVTATQQQLKARAELGVSVDV